MFSFQDTDINSQKCLIKFAQIYKTEKTENIRSKSEDYSGYNRFMSVFWSFWPGQIV